MVGWMRVLVTGAAGFMGNQVFTQFSDPREKLELILNFGASRTFSDSKLLPSQAFALKTS